MNSNSNEYFNIVSTEGRILFFEVKGFWSDVAVERFEEHAFASWKNAVDSYDGEAFVSMPDMTNFKVARSKGKALIARMMKYAQGRNLFHSVQVMPEAMARIVISESVRESGHGSFRSVVHNLEDGKKLARKKLDEIEN